MSPSPSFCLAGRCLCGRCGTRGSGWPPSGDSRFRWRENRYQGTHKRAAAAALLKLNPEQSDLAVAKSVGLDHKTVATQREVMVAGGEIPHHDTRTDLEERGDVSKLDTRTDATGRKLREER